MPVDITIRECSELIGLDVTVTQANELVDEPFDHQWDWPTKLRPWDGKMKAVVKGYVDALARLYRQPGEKLL